MSDYMTPAQLAQLAPRKQPAAYRLDGRFDLVDADGARRYHIQQARLFDVADCLPNGSFSRFIGVVTRRKAGEFVVMGENRVLGIITAGHFASETGECFRLIDLTEP
ncbi:hypothetical protein HNP46_004819 [Pseudomonas nitritireducens]|uniref:Uncharacterized protein n=1 Tax=Pseudomonas nitroreducens TaxID=46680 RepID=A0A7W7KP69_PSENT|nr:hypothetical protein [Pseudomonas nitritireducens]MBB4865918.1 hypothetical protein [Pseudomonas nitritireducens]